MTSRAAPAVGNPPDRRQELLQQLLLERYGEPIRSDRPAPDFEPDTPANTQVRRYLLRLEDKEN